MVFVIWDTVYRIDEDPACDMKISLHANILNIQKTRILNFFFSQEFFCFQLLFVNVFNENKIISLFLQDNKIKWKSNGMR